MQAITTAGLDIAKSVFRHTALMPRTPVARRSDYIWRANDGHGRR